MSKLVGHGAPTEKTMGVLGQEYFDIDSAITYTCVKVIHNNATTRTGEMAEKCEWVSNGSGGSLPEGLPYVEKTEGVLEFNGDLTGMEYVIGEGGSPWVKVTDKAYTKEELVGSVIRVTCEDDRMECPTGTWEYTLTEDDVIIQEDIGANYIVAHETMLVTIVTPEAELPEGFDMTAGTFFVYAPDIICVHSISCITGTTEVVHKLDEKFLPESVDGVIIRSSTEGSTKKFKLTVDDAGTVTATEV